MLTHHARWAADAKRVPFLLAEAKIPGGRTSLAHTRRSLWLCEAGFPTAVPKQILYPRQPDGLGLRAHPISGLRIGFSLLKHAVSQRAALREISFDILANEDAISGGRTSIGLAPLSLLPLRHRVSQRLCGVYFVVSRANDVPYRST